MTEIEAKNTVAASGNLGWKHFQNPEIWGQITKCHNQHKATKVSENKCMQFDSV